MARTFEGPCLAGDPLCEGTPDYLWADRPVYQRLKVFYDEDGKVWAEDDDFDLKPAPIEEEEPLEDVRCPNCGGVITESTELHKVARNHIAWEVWAEDRRAGR